MPYVSCLAHTFNQKIGRLSNKETNNNKDHKRQETQDLIRGLVTPQRCPTSPLRYPQRVSYQLHISSPLRPLRSREKTYFSMLHERVIQTSRSTTAQEGMALPRATPSRLGTTKVPRVTNRRGGGDVEDEWTRRVEVDRHDLSSTR